MIANTAKTIYRDRTKDGSERLANLLKAAADTLRLDILRVMRNGSFGVQELANIFSMPQPGMSHHLKILATAGLLATRRQGNSIFYRRVVITNDTLFAELCDAIYDAADAMGLDDQLAAAVDEVYRERSRQSQLFFEKHADELAHRQAQLCELDQYIENFRQLLDLCPVRPDGVVMEVGPGRGELLAELTARFHNVTALDRSSEMLRLAQSGMVDGKSHVEFVKEDLESYQPSHPFDLIVLNMVLHHATSPSFTFLKLSQLLATGGHLLIADLRAHSQVWTQELCGDLWPGFDPEELDSWARDAALIEKQSLYLGLKNGFQIQLKLFSKQS